MAISICVDLCSSAACLVGDERLQARQSLFCFVGFREIRLLAQTQGSFDFAASAELVALCVERNTKMETIARRRRAVAATRSFLIDADRLLQCLSSRAVQTLLVVNPAKRVGKNWHARIRLHRALRQAHGFVHVPLVI